MKQYSFSIKNKKEQTKSSIYDVSFYDYERELKQNSEKLLQSSRSISSILILVAINSPIISIFSTSLPISTDISKKTSFFLDDFVSLFLGEWSIRLSVSLTAGLSISLTAGLSIGCTAGLSVGCTTGLSVGCTAGLSIGCTAGLSVGCTAGLSIGCTAGLSLSCIAQVKSSQAEKSWMDRLTDRPTDPLIDPPWGG